MHSERLFSIIKRITKAYGEGGIVPDLDSLIAAVNSRISQPADRQFDEQISSISKSLFEKLDKSPMHEFPATWRKIIQELDLSILLPDQVRVGIEKAFETRLVDSDLLSGLQALKKSIAKKLDGANQLQRGFQAVGIEDDELGPGEVEFDIMMPRESIADQLPGFTKELGRLSTQMQVIASVAKSRQQSFTINSISTNDFSLAINIDLNLGEILAAILLGLTVIQSNYRSKADIIKNGLSDLPAKLLESFKEWANQYVKDEIGKLIERLPAECPDAVDAEKLLNNKVPLQAALEYLSEGQEKGFNMDVRAGLPTMEQPDGTASPDRILELEKEASRIRAITEKSAQMNVLERQTAPILSLTNTKTTDQD